MGISHRMVFMRLLQNSAWPTCSLRGIVSRRDWMGTQWVDKCMMARFGGRDATCTLASRLRLVSKEKWGGRTIIDRMACRGGLTENRSGGLKRST